MADISKESIAIVEATFQDLRSRHADATLGMWHHLLNHPERDLLFAPIDSGGLRSFTLLDALLISTKARSRGMWPRLRGPSDLQFAQVGRLEHAFRLAVQDVLGAMGPPMVVNAWCEVFRDFLEVLRGNGQ